MTDGQRIIIAGAAALATIGIATGVDETEILAALRPALKDPAPADEDNALFNVRLAVMQFCRAASGPDRSMARFHLRDAVCQYFAGRLSARVAA